MKSNRWFLITIMAVILVWTIKGYAGNLQMTTFYPAPNGFYDQLKVSSKLVIPCFNAPPSNPVNNSLWIVDATPGACPNPY